MLCPRCQHENRPQATLCEECTGPLREASPATRSNTDPKSEFESLRQAMTEAVEQQKATAELLQTRNHELTEAREQQATTSEILRAIATSPTDVQPVFATVLRSAARLCDAFDATIFQVDGDWLRIVAHEGPIPSTPLGALPLKCGTAAGRAVLDRRTIHVHDLQAEVDEYPESSAIARSYGFRTVLNVPLLRGAEAIGTISIRRTEVRPFTDRQIELLKTFADQAMIAIENVRLFKETKEALEQQTATAGILRVIASSPTDLQSALEAVAESAARLCESSDAIVFRVHGDELRPAAVHGAIGAVSNAISPGFVTGRAVLERRTIHVEDLAAAVAADFPDAVEHQRRFGHRTTLATPLLREGMPIGAITIRRLEVRPFTEAQVRLLETFADQAVIAIENIRLFTELQTRNAELTSRWSSRRRRPRSSG